MSEDTGNKEEEAKEAAETPKADPPKKRRGRPPGSKNKKSSTKKAKAAKPAAKEEPAAEEKTAEDTSLPSEATPPEGSESLRYPKEHKHYGLLRKLDYKFDELGFVDWKAMIPNKYIVLNEEACLKAGVDSSEWTPEQVEEYKETAP